VAQLHDRYMMMMVVVMMMMMYSRVPVPVYVRYMYSRVSVPVYVHYMYSRVPVPVLKFPFDLCYFDRYTIELKHGDFTWTIKKRYSHIQHLHQQLKLFRTSLSIPFPTRAHRERRNSFRITHSGLKPKNKNKEALPRYVLLLFK